MAAPKGMAGFGDLGSTIIGGNGPNETLAEAQGMSLGANTQNAIAEAHIRQQKTQANDTLSNMTDDQAHAAGMTGGAAQARAYALMLAQSEHPKDYQDALAKAQETAQRATAADTTQSDAVRAGAMYGAAGSAMADQTKNLGDGLISNVLHPDINGTGAMQTNISQATAAEKNADAFLKTQQGMYPDKFKAAPLSITPAQADSIARAKKAGYDVTIGRSPQAAAEVADALLAGDAGKTTTGGIDLAQQKATGRYFAGGAGGQQTDSINRSAQHLQMWVKAQTDLNNGNLVPANEVKQYMAKMFGSGAPTSNDLIAKMLAGETSKAASGTGVTALEDRKALESSFNSATSAGAVADIERSTKGLLAGQATSLEQHYKQTKKDDYRTAHLMPQVSDYLMGSHVDPDAPASATAATGANAALDAALAKYGTK